MKKKWTAILTAIAILAASAIAYAEPAPALQNSIQEPVWVDHVKQTKTFGLTGASLETSYPVLTVGSSKKEALQQALDTYSEKIRVSSEDFADEQEVRQYSQFRRSPGSGGGAHCLTTSSVVRSDEQILSILTTTETYTYPAAHGMTGYDALNFDPETGKALSLSDIVKTPDNLPAILDEAFSRQYDPKLLDTSVYKVTKDMMAANELCFVVGMEGVTFIYPVYSLWAYAYGPCFLTLSYADYPQLFVEKYAVSGDYLTVLAPYRTYTFSEDGVYKKFCFSDRIKEYQLSFLGPDDEWVTYEKAAYTNTADAVHLMRKGGKYTFYVRTSYWFDEMVPSSGFMAFTVAENGALQETTVSPEAVKAILSPSVYGKIDREVFLHPEHLAYERFAHHESDAIFPGGEAGYDYLEFPEEATQKHAFIDLDGDGIDEMLMINDVYAWPYWFFRYNNDYVESIGPNGEDVLVTSSIPSDIYVDSSHRIIVHDHTHAGREYYVVCQLNQNKQISRMFTYSRIWENYDESQDASICIYSVTEGDNEITLEQYNKAVEKLMTGVLELEFKE